MKELSSSSFKSLPPVLLCSIVFAITARYIEAIFSKDIPQSNAKFMSSAKTKERGDPFERDAIKSRTFSIASIIPYADNALRETT